MPLNIKTIDPNDPAIINDTRLQRIVIELHPGHGGWQDFRESAAMQQGELPPIISKRRHVTGRNFAARLFIAELTLWSKMNRGQFRWFKFREIIADAEDTDNDVRQRALTTIGNWSDVVGEGYLFTWRKIKTTIGAGRSTYVVYISCVKWVRAEDLPTRSDADPNVTVAGRRSSPSRKSDTIRGSIENILKRLEAGEVVQDDSGVEYEEGSESE